MDAIVVCYLGAVGEPRHGFGRRASSGSERRATQTGTASSVFDGMRSRRGSKPSGRAIILSDRQSRPPRHRV
jgi:hypothetical protein